MCKVDAPSPTTSDVSDLLDALSRGNSGVLELVGDPASVHHVAETAFASLTGSATVDLGDIRWTAPKGDRWTVTEVAEQVLEPVQQMSHGPSWYLVVADSAAMTHQGATRLLRTIEEPPTPAWFILCRDPSVAFPTAVAGRVGATINAAATGTSSPFEDAVETSGQMDALQALTAPGDVSGNSLAAAAKWSRSARAIAKVLKPKPAGPWLRRITYHVLDVWAGEAEQLLRHHPDSREVAAAVESFAHAEHLTRTATALFVAPEAAMGPLLVAYTSLRAASTT